MKAIILARVSTKEREEGHSIGAQRRRLDDYCARKGLDVIPGPSSWSSPRPRASAGNSRRITQDEYDTKARELKERRAEIAARIEQHREGEDSFRTTLESLLSMASRAEPLRVAAHELACHPKPKAGEGGGRVGRHAYA